MNKQQEPRLRFQGFTGAWEEQKIIEIADYVDYRGKTPRKTEEGIFLITAKNVKMGSLDYKVSQEFIAIEDFESVMSRGKAEIGDVLITTEAPLGNVAQIDREDVALAQRVIKYRGMKGILNNDFLTQKFLTNTFQVTLSSLSSGGTVQGIKGSLLHQIEIKYPSLPEQTYLGLFFRRLDSQIAESRAVLEKSHQLKKAMLAKMFPANGEKIPKIRFKGFEGEWERKTLGEVADIVRGASPRPIQDPKWFDEKSDIGWLRIADVTAQNGRIHYLEQKISKAGQENTRVLEEPHLLLSIAASVGKPVINYVKTGVHDGFLIFRNPDFELEFMYQYLDSFVESWQRYGQPGTQVNLNSDIVKNAEFFIPPTKSEQTQIGNFFRQLDETIALQSAEVEKLNQLKKGLLAAMLV
jgi:restriction modification system DNA specificity domain protein